MAITPIHEALNEIERWIGIAREHADQIALGTATYGPTDAAPVSTSTDSEALANAPKGTDASHPTVEGVDNNAGVADGESAQGSTPPADAPVVPDEPKDAAV